MRSGGYFCFFFPLPWKLDRLYVRQRRSRPQQGVLIDASVGTIVNTIDLDSPAFSQAVFAEKYVFAATSSGDLACYTPS